MNDIVKRLADKAAARELAKSQLDELMTAEGALETAANDTANELQELQNKPAETLFKAYLGGLFLLPEVNSILIDAFGAKVTSTGKTSKTPMGKGEVIRKRVVRAYQATSFALDPESERPKFLEGVELDAILPIVNDLISEKPERSLFTAYDDLGALKVKEPIPSFLNATAILKQAKAITENAGTIAEHPEAVEAYGALQAALQTLQGVLDMVGAASEKAAKAA